MIDKCIKFILIIKYDTNLKIYQFKNLFFCYIYLYLYELGNY